MHALTSSLLLVTHVPIRKGPAGPQIDDQTAAGIVQWCKAFERVTYIGMEEEAGSAKASSSQWVDLSTFPGAQNCRVLALPRAYRMQEMARHRRPVMDLIRREIAAHSHLCFTLGGLNGDWPALAAKEAIRQDRPYSAWLDRVEPLIVAREMKEASFKSRLFWRVALPLFDRRIRSLLSRSTVALLQGRDTYDYYARFAPSPHCTYDTHTSVADEIDDAALAAKRARILEKSPLTILYVGRAAPMKGPGDWLSVLEALDLQSIPFRATWIGDGPDLARMQERVARSGLTDQVVLHGFEGNRAVLLRAMRESDLLLFCHKTPESPRCLIEALVSGCPLVGYETAYPKGLVEARGGGLFVPQDDVAALTACVRDLHADRQALARLVDEAAASGRLYNEDDVYAHRAGLMKQAGAMARDHAALAT